MIPLETIKSTANPRFRALKALSRRRIREREGLYIAEGFHLVGEALRAKAFIDGFYISPRGEDRAEGKAMLAQAEAQHLKVFSMADELLDELSEVEGPEGILATARLAYMELDELVAGLAPDAILVVADGLQDPGNLGTIIRTAHAAGAAGLVLAPDTVDPFNGKTLRAAMGSHFYLPLARAGDERIAGALSAAGVRLLATDPHAGEPLWNTDLSGRIAFLLGSEAAGPRRQLLKAAEQRVRIPMPGGAESLNVAVATAISLYEAVRQRGHAGV